VTPEAIVGRLRAVVAAEGPAPDSEISLDMITVTVPAQAWVPALACAGVTVVFLFLMFFIERGAESRSHSA